VPSPPPGKQPAGPPVRKGLDGDNIVEAGLLGWQRESDDDRRCGGRGVEAIYGGGAHAAQSSPLLGDVLISAARGAYQLWQKELQMCFEQGWSVTSEANLRRSNTAVHIEPA